MTNKHFCQGTNCHQYITTDRFLKSKGIIRGRYAMFNVDSDNDWHARGKYFCSTGCENAWLNVNMENIERGIPVSFITHRRISEGYHKVTHNITGGSYSSIQKISVDNDNENDRIIL